MATNNTARIEKNSSNNTARVFIPQEPTKWDDAAKMRVPSINVAPAAKFGKLEILLPPQVTLLYPDPIVRTLKERFNDITGDDYLLAVGDPSLIAICAGLFLQQLGSMKLLKWDRASQVYLTVRIQI